MDGVNVSFYDEGLVYGKGLALQAQVRQRSARDVGRRALAARAALAR